MNDQIQYAWIIGLIAFLIQYTYGFLLIIAAIYYIIPKTREMKKNETFLNQIPDFIKNIIHDKKIVVIIIFSIVLLVPFFIRNLIIMGKIFYTGDLGILFISNTALFQYYNIFWNFFLLNFIATNTSVNSIESNILTLPWMLIFFLLSFIIFVVNFFRLGKEGRNKLNIEIKHRIVNNILLFITLLFLICYFSFIFSYYFNYRFLIPVFWIGIVDSFSFLDFQSRLMILYIILTIIL